jgi:Glycosyl transferase family 2
MKLVMTLLVRDEEDIIRDNIEFHLAQGVDFFIATDNRSVDATTKILKEYEERGLLHYIYEGNDDFDQSAWVTRMARMAFSDYGADWVIHSDADEFWWPLHGNLREVFECLPGEVSVVFSNRLNFVAVDSDSGQPFWSRMIYREKESLNLLGKSLRPKIAHRGNATVIVHQGNHSVAGMAMFDQADGLIEILHFPVREYKQIENKIILGGEAYARNSKLPKAVGLAWRELHEAYKDSGNLNQYFRDQQHDSDKLNKRLQAGDIVIDKKLRDYFFSGAVGTKIATASDLSDRLLSTIIKSLKQYLKNSSFSPNG